MDIHVRAEMGITVVELSGELTSKSVTEAQKRILEQVTPDGKLVLDMSRTVYMSSAGLRLLLIVYRKVADQGGRVLLVGVSGEIRDTMEYTGFLNFFTLCDSLDVGIAQLTS